MTTIVFDIDFLLFAAASVAEEVFVTVVHKETGVEMEFENATEFHGHHGKKIGGWIGLQNELSGGDYYKSSDYNIIPGKRPRPFRIKGKDGEPDTFLSPMDGAKQVVTEQINAINRKFMADSYLGFTGKGDVFRHDLATLLPYKGNRVDMASPLILHELKEWAVQAHNTQWVYGIEADDACNMYNVEGYKKWIAGGKQDEDKVIQVAIDKDTKGNDGWHYNPNKDDKPRLIEGFGSLWLNSKGEPDGAGRMFLYWQIAHGDSTDGYIANCFSDKRYAGKGAYNDLKDCSNDKEAWTKLVEIFKWMYPEKKTVTTFRGEIEIDAMYIMQEMALLAMMLRKPGDTINVKAVCDKLGVAYD